MLIELQSPPAAYAQAPSRSGWRAAVSLIEATVQIDQPSGEGTRTVGTGFLLNAPMANGAPRTVLVTAAHVLDRMPEDEARIGWREVRTDGGWRFDPQPLRIRDPAGAAPLWTRHPDHDIAVMEIVAPPAFAQAAIPISWLADETVFQTLDAGPGDELLSLGFPRGLSSNPAGFPILRVGRIASWPLWPIATFPTFLLDFSVHPGNSGGPVFRTARPGERFPSDHPQVLGVLTQEVIVKEERLGIAVVAHAEYVREAVALLDAVQDRSAP